MKMPRFSRDLRTSLLAGVATGVLGVAAFLTVHAFLITPIWDGLPRGLPFGVFGGLAVGWAFHTLWAAGRLSMRFRDGVRFGALLWLALVPMTGIDVLLRKTGVRTMLGGGEVAVEVILALAGGALLGWLLTRRLRAAVAVGLATLVLAMGMGGPIPVTGTPRAAGLFGAFLVIYAGCGFVLILLRAGLARITETPAARESLAD